MTRTVLAEFSVAFDEAPPVSTNKLYTVFMGRKTLTEPGKHFRAMLSAAVTQVLPLDWDRVVEEADGWRFSWRLIPRWMVWSDWPCRLFSAAA